MRPLPLLLSLSLLLFGVSFAQSPIEQMRDLLERGYYNSAARVIGPGLVQSNPDSAEAHYLYSRALYLTGEVDAARELLVQALQLTEGEVEPDYQHLDGLLLAAEGDLEGGAQLVQGAFARSGEYEHAMDWGRLAWQAYRLEEALGAYDAAAQTESGRRSSWPHLNRGRLLTFLGRNEQAITAYRRAIEVFEENDTGEARPSPAYVEAYFRLGEIYEVMGQAQGSARFLQLAADHYRAALTGDPNYAPAIEALDSLSRRLP
ncbi:MAG: tetratricopeptide repeat protein [Trueperaceae bacterium]